MQEFFGGRRYLGARDRRVIAGMVFDVLRQFTYLRTIASDAFVRAAGEPGTPTRALALLLVHALVVSKEEIPLIQEGFGALWRTFMRSPPLEAAIPAVRQAHECLIIPGDPVGRLSLLHSCPTSVVRDWVTRFGEAEAEQLCIASNSPPPVALRVNTLRCTVEECRAALAAEGVEAAPSKLSPSGLILTKRMHAAGLRTFRMGWFEMQDEGSQLLSLLVEPRPGETIVDACAGAGGKTLHMASLMENRGRILALDVSRKRLESLRERAVRAGVTIAFAALPGGAEVRELAGRADTVLIDAPCSGTGTFRRNPGAKAMYNESALVGLLATQRRLLDESAGLVRPGGTLVYTTCSLLHCENGEQAERFLSSHADFHLASAPEILQNKGVRIASASLTIELLPHVTGTDGFFAAVMRRAESD
jgi:16S rRNA (cytosine967-C5)-methyltransferase